VTTNQKTNRVFELAIDFIPGYPRIDYSVYPNNQYDWLPLIERMELLEAGVEHVTRKIELKVQTPLKQFDALIWHTSFIVSELVKRVLQKIGVDHVHFFPAMVNDSTFYFLIVKKQIDCLNREKSDLEYFKSTPGGKKD
jgi:hypothetical protein